MPSGTCSTPVAADVYGGSCYSYCATTSSDCSVCPSNTYYEGYGTNTACDACDDSMVIADDGNNASAHDEAGDCVWSPTPVPTLVPTTTPMPSKVPTPVPTTTPVPTPVPTAVPTGQPSPVPTTPVPIPAPTAVPIPVPTKVSSIGCDKCAILVPSSNKNLSLHHFS